MPAAGNFGAKDRIRTCDPRLTRSSLYRAELLWRVGAGSAPSSGVSSRTYKCTDGGRHESPALRDFKRRGLNPQCFRHIARAAIVNSMTAAYFAFAILGLSPPQGLPIPPLIAHQPAHSPSRLRTGRGILGFRRTGQSD